MSQLRIGILGNVDSWYVKDLRRAAEHELIEVLSFRDLQVGCDEQGAYAKCSLAEERSVVRRLGSVDSDYDLLLIRTMPLGSVEQIIFRMNALQVAERSGLLLVNSARCLEIAIDKWLTLDRLQVAGLPVPSTRCCQTRDAAMVAWSELGEDCVVKPLFGGEGRGLMRVTDADMAWRVFGTLEQLGAILYLQRFIAHPGYDLRLLVIGQQVHAVKRCNTEDWRTNLSRGAVAEPHDATPREQALALKAAEVVGGFMVGVDLLPGLDGSLQVLEVNAVPGWRGTAKALQHDIAGELLGALRPLLLR